MQRLTVATVLSLALFACNSSSDGTAAETPTTNAISPVDQKPYAVTEVATFDEPWAMTFLPDSNRLLVTEIGGTLKLVELDGPVIDVGGVPEVDRGGQGGFGDVILAPDFATSGMIYLSWVEAGDDDTSGAVVGRGKLVMADDGRSAKIEGLRVIWRQDPKVTGNGHFSHRLAFSPDGEYLFIGSGDRQKFDPAQDMNANLGKILRLFPDGRVPEDNPFYGQGGVAAQVWSLGHRNILGLAFDAEGRLWNQEMGPKGGDELNLVVRGANYGWPIVSNGDHYDGRPIPDHDTRPEFKAPRVSWNPVISPAGLVFYSGDLFPQWKGSAFIGGLSSESVVRVAVAADGTAREVERFDMNHRIREIEQGPDGALWLLEDGPGGRLLKLTPRN